MAGLNFSGSVTLVTGASSGIGAAMARQLAARGSHVLLVARSGEKLRTLAQQIEESGGKASVFECDLRAARGALDLIREVNERGFQVDYLVNNAGVGSAGALLEVPVEVITDMLELNVRALTELTRLFLPGMVERRRGGVLLVASILAYFPTPKMAAYAASKAYVRSFGEALREEVRGTNVAVTILAPGNVPSGFQRAAGFGDQLPLPGTLGPEAVARDALRAFAARRAVVIPGTMNRFTRAAVALVPNTWLARLALFVLGKLGRF